MGNLNESQLISLNSPFPLLKIGVFSCLTTVRKGGTIGHFVNEIKCHRMNRHMTFGMPIPVLLLHLCISDHINIRIQIYDFSESFILNGVNQLKRARCPESTSMPTYAFIPVVSRAPSAYLHDDSHFWGTLHRF